MARSPKLPAAVFETVLLDRLDLTRHGAGPRAKLRDGKCFPIALSLSKSAMLAEGLSAAVQDQLQRDQEQKLRTGKTTEKSTLSTRCMQEPSMVETREIRAPRARLKTGGLPRKPSLTPLPRAGQKRKPAHGYGALQPK